MGEDPTSSRLLGADLGPGQRTLLERAGRAGGFHDDVPRALAWAVEAGREAPHPGSGRTVELWQLLAEVAAVDVGLARILEPHLDALAILGQAPAAVELDGVGAGPDSTWGVYAAEAPGTRLTARRTTDGWALDGVKPWCSLAGDLSHALVTAQTEGGERGLFAVALRTSAVHAADGPWPSRGLRQVVSAPVRFEAAPAVPVGDAGWYLTRPGFAWGGMAVAACWWGGAVGVARALEEGCRRREPDQLAQAYLGAVDAVLSAGRAVLRDAAREVDDGVASRAGGEIDGRHATDRGPAIGGAADPGILARRVRAVVAAGAEEVLRHVGHALGPAPLALDEDHGRRVADLTVYLRQHHASRDHASLGRALLAREVGAW